MQNRRNPPGRAWRKKKQGELEVKENFPEGPCLLPRGSLNPWLALQLPSAVIQEAAPPPPASTGKPRPLSLAPPVPVMSLGWELHRPFTEAVSEGLWLGSLAGGQLVGTKAFLCQPVRTKFFTKSLRPTTCLSISCRAQAVSWDWESAGIERFKLWLPGVGPECGCRS